MRRPLLRAALLLGRAAHRGGADRCHGVRRPQPGARRTGGTDRGDPGHVHLRAPTRKERRGPGGLPPTGAVRPRPPYRGTRCAGRGRRGRITPRRVGGDVRAAGSRGSVPAGRRGGAENAVAEPAETSPAHQPVGGDRRGRPPRRPRPHLTLAQYIELVRAMVEAEAAPATDPPDRVRRWLARTKVLRKRQRAFGSESTLRQWITDRAMQLRETPLPA